MLNEMVRLCELRLSVKSRLQAYALDESVEYAQFVGYHCECAQRNVNVSMIMSVFF